MCIVQRWISYAVRVCLWRYQASRSVKRSVADEAQPLSKKGRIEVSVNHLLLLATAAASTAASAAAGGGAAAPLHALI